MRPMRYDICTYQVLVGIGLSGARCDNDKMSLSLTFSGVDIVCWGKTKVLLKVR